MPVRHASAVWEGDLPSGKGQMKLGSGGFEEQYSFSSRFEEGSGTNPEELIGAAHAGCFSMQFANQLAQAGYKPKRVQTIASVNLAKAGDGYKITTLELKTEAHVEGIEQSTFQEIAEQAKKSCPVSQLVTGAEIQLKAHLVG